MSALRKEAILYDYDKEYLKKSPKKKRIKIKKKNTIVIDSFKNSAMIFITFLLGLLIIYNYAVITDKKVEINKINEEIVQLNNDIDGFNVTLESMKNTNKIEEMAKTHLGMNYPTRKQTVFLDFKDVETNTEEIIEVAENKGQLYGLIDKVISFIQ